MLRTDIEKYLKQHNISQIDLIINKDDRLAVFCRVKSGKLYDFTDHVIDRKKDIWGYLKWTNGSAERVEFHAQV